MKKIVTSIFSLFFLFVLSLLFYLAWILNKGEFKSQFLEEFLNNRLKKPGLFYSKIENPAIQFDKKTKKLIIKGDNIKVFTDSNQNIAEFETIKVYLNLIDLIINRKLDANKIELNNGIVDYTTVFRKPLQVDKIYLEGKLYPDNNQITLSKFSTNMGDDYYEGSAMINLDEFQTIGNLQKLIRKNIFYNMDLESETLEFVLNSSGFDIEGESTLGGIDVVLKGRKNYKNHEEFISRYTIKTIINEKDIENFFNFKIEEFVSGPIGLDATYFIFKNNKETIKTKNNLKNNNISFPLLGLSKEIDIDANADINFNFQNGFLNSIKILEYNEKNKKISGNVEFSTKFKPYKKLELDYEKNSKKVKIELDRSDDLTTLKLKADYFNFIKILEDFLLKENNEDNPLKQFQPLKIFLDSKEILVATDNSIFDTSATMNYDNNLFKEVKLNSVLEKDKTFSLNIFSKNNLRQVEIKSNDAGLLLRKFNVNKSGKEGEFVMSGQYDDTKSTHPLTSTVTIRDMRLIKAPVLAKILNLASIGIVSALSGEGILINKLKSRFILEDGVLHLEKYEAYGPDIGFSNQGNVYLRKKEIDLEGALIPMVTLNKIIGSIPILGKILTNERKGIWSFAYTIKGDLNKPKIQVNPLKTITPGFIQKFFSVFQSEDKGSKN